MNKRRMNVMLSGVTALCMTCTMMSNAIVFAQDNTDQVVEGNSTETETPDWYAKEEKYTTFYKGEYFDNEPTPDCEGALEKALIAAYMDDEGDKVIYCRPGADVGTMTHGHVADSITIHGNEAYVSAGERDLEIDTYIFDKETGKYADKGTELKGPITVTVNKLNGIAAWGERRSDHKVTLKFNDCKNMQRVYITTTSSYNGPVGEVNIDLKKCSFVGDPNGEYQDGERYPHARYGTTIYSNYNGTINVEDCVFDNIDVAFNMNHKVDGEQTVNIKNTTFTNCGQARKASKTYAAPIRIVAKEGATSNLSVENCEFIYTEGKKNCGNGDVLIGDGRHDAGEEQGTVNLSMSETKAEVMAQKKGYYTDAMGENKEDSNAVKTPVEKNQVVDQPVSVTKPAEPKPAPGSGSGSGGGGGSTAKVSPVYRAYNPNNGEHLYTLDEKEYKHVASLGWHEEGIAFMGEEEKNGLALFRVYNPNSGLHHYTLDETEKNILVSLGWQDEKVAWYTSKKPQSAPVYRVYNPNDGNHHYTMDANEKDVLILLGWHDEGLAFRTAPLEA